LHQYWHQPVSLCVQFGLPRVFVAKSIWRFRSAVLADHGGAFTSADSIADSIAVAIADAISVPVANDFAIASTDTTPMLDNSARV
jgi:hypothetical protein